MKKAAENALLDLQTDADYLISGLACLVKDINDWINANRRKLKMAKKTISIATAAEMGITVIGDMSYRNPNCPTEAAEQMTFFNNLPEHIKAVAFHAKNEGRKTHGQAAHDKAQGLVPGVPDISIPGLNILIELKRQDPTKSRVGVEQVEYLLAAKKLGAKVCIALGYKNALNFL